MIHDIVNSLIELLEGSTQKNKQNHKKDIHRSKARLPHSKTADLVAWIIITMLLVKLALVLFGGQK